MRTRYKIDTYQQNYFVIDSLEALFHLTAADFTALYRDLALRPEVAPGAREAIEV
jgi:phenylalanine-4-hydroxylase